MLPFLYRNEAYHIYVASYGMMLALGFISGYLLTCHLARLKGQSKEHVYNLVVYIAAAALIGARLFHVFFEDFHTYRQHPLKILAFWQPGFSFYGGLVGAGIVSYIYMRKNKLSPLIYLDLFAPSLMLGQVFGRIGCFLAGCCWGKPTDLPWGVVFTDPHSLAGTPGIPLHPTQLYQALWNLGGAVFLYSVAKGKTYFPGKTLSLYLIVYPIGRFLIEFFRGDAYRGFVIPGVLSTPQLLSSVLFVIGVPLYFFFRKRSNSSEE
jgi:phosphatidylglycerol:prolipoprotein diacylglycerol transferase